MSVKILTVKEDILGFNEQKAKANQELVDKQNILMINITSSPGAGKTSLIMQTISRVKEKYRMAVIEGDIASSIDADKVSNEGIPAVQINTAGACHLDANMVRKALDNINLEETDLVLIENVGNLVCTAEFALGAHKQVMLLSVPEGDDKPHKYPLMFTQADVVLVNKTDVLPYFDFNMSAFSRVVTGLNPASRVIPISAKTGDGLDQWVSWLDGELSQRIGANQGGQAKPES
jgi:hydrogenase nickel incorporation protein HypB